MKQCQNVLKFYYNPPPPHPQSIKYVPMPLGNAQNTSEELTAPINHQIRVRTGEGWGREGPY